MKLWLQAKVSKIITVTHCGDHFFLGEIAPNVAMLDAASAEACI